MKNYLCHRELVTDDDIAAFQSQVLSYNRDTLRSRNWKKKTEQKKFIVANDLNVNATLNKWIKKFFFSHFRG